MAFLDDYFQAVAHKMPGLSLKLRQARLPDTPEGFVRKAYTSAFILSLLLTLTILGFGKPFNMPVWIPFLAFPLLFLLLKSFFLHQPDAIIAKRKRQIESELIFATRFLMIEIQSGVNLYDAMINLAENYEGIGKEFSDIINKVQLGTSLEEAVEEATELTPSDNMKKVLWQITNSLKTGADMADALKAVSDQISREQLIAVNEYGRKLNPLAMFYMMLAVILPSIGLTMTVILSNFFPVNIKLGHLLGLAVFLGLMQLMFYNMILTMRPPVAL